MYHTEWKVNENDNLENKFLKLVLAYCKIRWSLPKEKHEKHQPG